LPNAPLPNTAPNDPPVSNADAAPEPAPKTPSPIDELTAAFEAAMEELINGFSGVSALPPISEPEGNGRAYQKFLEIYNQMH
jgi:hypothetical protein